MIIEIMLFTEYLFIGTDFDFKKINDLILDILTIFMIIMISKIVMMILIDIMDRIGLTIIRIEL